jgi:tetratricopeptide (TPR) repeat protein
MAMVAIKMRRLWVEGLRRKPNAKNAGTVKPVTSLNGIASREILKARELDPLSLVINGLVGFIHMRARQYDRAIAECHKAIELDPNHPFGHWLLARSLDAADQAKDALGEARAAAKLSGYRPPYSSHLRYAFARAGQLDAAKKVLEALGERRKTEYVSPYDFAHIYVALGEADLAFDWLDKSFQERTPQLSGDLWEPIFDQLRHHSLILVSHPPNWPCSSAVTRINSQMLPSTTKR